MCVCWVSSDNICITLTQHITLMMLYKKKKENFTYDPRIHSPLFFAAFSLLLLLLRFLLNVPGWRWHSTTTSETIFSMFPVDIEASQRTRRSSSSSKKGHGQKGRRMCVNLSFGSALTLRLTEMFFIHPNNPYTIHLMMNDSIAFPSFRFYLSASQACKQASSSSSSDESMERHKSRL